jgi:hypothetical protein
MPNGYSTRDYRILQQESELNQLRRELATLPRWVRWLVRLLATKKRG